MEEINLTEVYSYFKARIIYILIAVVVVLIVGNIYTLLIKTPMYQSNTTIVLVSEEKDNFSQSDLQLNQKLVATYSQIIKSRKVVSKVIDNLNLKTSVAALSNNISATAVTDTEIIKISVNSSNAKEAALITDEVARVFSDEIISIYHLDNVSVLDKAEIPKTPYNVNFLKDNVIYLLVGIILSFGGVFIMYYFDTTIKSSEVIEDKFGLTVLGIVPREGKE